jgi:phospholipase/lecithinase/hemolysin
MPGPGFGLRASRAGHRSLSVTLALVVCFATLSTRAVAGLVGGVGVMGDSLSDEYAFPIFKPPGGDRTSSLNYVQILSRTRGFDFGSFSTASRGSPRNEGFAFNWAEDGSTSTDLITKGQHTGVAAQAAAGQVRTAILFIGVNDIRSVFVSPDPAAALQQVVPTLLTNVSTAAQTILAADPDVRLVIGNLADVIHTPQAQFAIQAGQLPPQLVAGVEQVTDVYNQQLAGAFAGNNRVAIADVHATFEEMFAGPSFMVGSLTMNRTTPGGAPTDLFADIVHPGTIAQGFLANDFIDALDSKFGAGITPLSQSEIVEQAIPLPAPAGPALVTACVALVPFVRARRRARMVE